VRPKATLRTHQLPLGTETLNLGINFSKLKEVKYGGQTLTGSPVGEVYTSGDGGVTWVATGDFILSNVAFDSTSTVVNFTLTNVSAALGGKYMVGFQVQLSGGEKKVTALGVEVAHPSGLLEPVNV
jgi:hypothetical protein